MNGNLFVVFEVSDPQFGVIAYATKIPRDTNLIPYGQNKRYLAMNVCNTWKEAQEVADYWNKCYKANGRQRGL